jgi:hypothetical protein
MATNAEILEALKTAALSWATAGGAKTIQHQGESLTYDDLIKKIRDLESLVSADETADATRDPFRMYGVRYGRPGSRGSAS